MRIVLIHGFNVRDGGAGTVDKLVPFLEEAGHEVDKDEADYGWFGLWAVRFRKASAVRRIAKALEHADAVISHSNGSNYEHKALKALNGRGCYRVIRLSPALNRTTGAAKNVGRCYVYHTLSDVWTWLSGWLPWHPWGRQGWRGYLGRDDRIVNRDFSDTIRGHSGWFDDDAVAYVADEILLSLEAP